jgi:UDP-glucose:(heptosyl)LPS alpha-1,3-glucosyltransferase
MRIALTYPFVNRRGGIERIVVECANQLDVFGHEVQVFASQWDRDVLAPGVRRHAVPTRQRPDALATLQYRRRATRELERAAGTLDAHASFSALSPLGGVFWIPSVHRVGYELVLERRGLLAGAVQRLNPFHRIRLVLEQQMYAPGGHAHLVAPSEGVRADVIEHYGVPEEDVSVNHFGFDPVQFNAARRLAARDEARAELGYGDDERVVVFVGNELERKGFDTLIEAVAALGRPEVNVLLVGRVDLGPYESAIERLGLSGRVRCVGSSGDVARQHAAADVFALPTRYEAWGLVIVEALGSGLPVLTSRLAGAAVTLRPGVGGELIDDPDDVAEVAERLGRLLDGGAADPHTISDSVAWVSWPEVVRRHADILARYAR